jgi:hypothetical protein
MTAESWRKPAAPGPLDRGATSSASSSATWHPWAIKLRTVPGCESHARLRKRPRRLRAKHAQILCSVVLTAGTQAGNARRWPKPAGFSGAAVPQPGPTQSHVQNTANKPQKSFLPAAVPVYSLAMNPTQKEFSLTGVSLNKANSYHLLLVFSACLMLSRPSPGQTQWTASFGNGKPLFAERIDWNNNGTNDLLITTETQVLVYAGKNGLIKWQLTPPNPGSGWFLVQGCANQSQIVSSNRIRSIPGDVDGDGKPDVLVVWAQFQTASRNYSMQLQLFDLTTQAMKWQKKVDNSSSGVVYTGELDGDGRMEIYYSGYTGYDNSSGSYIDRTLYVLDGSNGMIASTRPMLYNLKPGVNGASFDMTTQPNKLYRIEGSSNLVLWQDLTNLISNGSSMRFTDERSVPAGGMNQFYRGSSP